MISPLTIQNILDSARIEEVVGDFVSLKKRGTSLIGLCPFHNEKTPSFHVSQAKGIYKCFGCGKAGNSLKFIMEHEKLTYPDAIRFLAAKYKIEIEEKEVSPEEKIAIDERESLYALNKFAAAYFNQKLTETEEGKAVGMSYFKEREFTIDTIKKFQLGYSTDKWDDLTTEAQQQGYKIEYLEKTGLTISKESKHYDRFRGRVMFPIHSLSGRVLGFGGRILTSDKSSAKYVNSPESEIYHKGSTLYGIHFSRNAIVSKDECFLVEGYTDVISLHQAGFENVVASSGTALTTEQIKQIKRFTNNITILYDGDEAGIKASFRGIDMFLEQGMNVKIVLFPDGEDPDSYVRKHRQIEVKEFLAGNAVNFILFKTRILLNEAKNDPIKRTLLIKEIVNSIAMMPDAISRNVYVRECSSLMNVAEQSLMNELNKILRKNFDKRHTEKTEEQEVELPEIKSQQESQLTFDVYDSENQERNLIRLLILYGTIDVEADVKNKAAVKQPVAAEEKLQIGRFIVSEIEHDEISFHNPVYQKVFNNFKKCLEEGFIPDDMHFVNYPEEEISIVAIDLVHSPYVLSDWERKKIYVKVERDVLASEVTETVLAFKLKKIERIISDATNELRTNPSDEDVDIILQRIKLLTGVRNEIAKRLERIMLR
jgi:DNA primase